MSCPGLPQTFPESSLPPPKVIRDVTYAELFGSPQESYQGQQGQMTRQFLVDWADRWIFCQRLLGFSEVVTFGDTNYFSRVCPVPYQENQLWRGIREDTDPNEQKFWLYPTDVQSIEGLGPLGKNLSTDTCIYEKAKVTVQYGSLPYKPRTDEAMVLQGFTRRAVQTSIGGGGFNTTYGDVPDEATLTRYVTRHIAPNAEFLTLPFGVTYWAAADGPEAASPVTANLGLIIATTEVQYTWHQVPSYKHVRDSDVSRFGPIGNSLPTAARISIGAVNKNTFDFAPPGCMLLTGVELQPFRMVGGLSSANVIYKMKYFEAVDPSTGQSYAETNGVFTPTAARGHNYFLHWDPNGGSPSDSRSYRYDLVTHNGNYPEGDPLRGANPVAGKGGRPIFRTTDFADLFRPDPPRLAVAGP